MISYKYFHTPSGYEHVTNPNNRDAAIFAEYMRNEISETEYCLYAVASDGGRFIMRSEDDLHGNQLINGLFCTDAEMGEATPILSFAQINEREIARMTSGGRYTSRPISLSTVAPDACALAKLMDQLLFSDNTNGLVLGVNGYEEAESYLKMLYFVLPTGIMNKAGFFVTASTPAAQGMRYTSESGEEINISLRLSVLVSRLSSSQYSNLSVFNTVIDSVSHKDNCDAPLSALGEYISTLDLRDFNAVSKLRSVIQRVYTDGKIDLDMLKLIIALEEYNYAKTLGAAHGATLAEKLILVYVEAPENIKAMGYDAVTDAVRYLLAAEYMTPSQSVAVNRIRSSDESIKLSTDDDYAGNKISNLSIISTEEIGELKDYLVGRSDHFNTLLEAARKVIPADTVRVDALFRVLIKALFDKRNSKLLTDDSYPYYLSELVALSSINNRYKVIPLAEQNGGEKIFDVISELADEESRVTVLAMLMLSAYLKDANKGGRRIRLKGFKRAIHKDGVSAAEEINLIISVYEKIEEMTYQISGASSSTYELDGKFTEFIFDEGAAFGEDWICDELIGDMSIEALVTAAERINNMSSPYEALRNKVNARLCDASFAKDATFKQLENRELLARLREIYGRIHSEAPVGDSGELKAFVESLRLERNISARFEKFRTDFTKSLYGTFSEKSRKKVTKKSPESALESKNPRQKIKIVEAVIDEFGMDRKVEKNNKRSGIFLWSLLFTFISVILISLPPLVQAIVTGPLSFSAFFSRVLSFVELWHVAVPILAMAVNMIFFLIKGNLRKANTVTLFCVVLPMVCYVVAFLVFYFIRLDVSFIKSLLGGG